MFETETFRNEGPLWPCGCLVGNPYCRCGVDDPAAEQAAEEAAATADD
jgi:hypothetical protein